MAENAHGRNFGKIALTFFSSRSEWRDTEAWSLVWSRGERFSRPASVEIMRGGSCTVGEHRAVNREAGLCLIGRII